MKEGYTEPGTRDDVNLFEQSQISLCVCVLVALAALGCAVC